MAALMNENLNNVLIKFALIPSNFEPKSNPHTVLCSNNTDTIRLTDSLTVQVTNQQIQVAAVYLVIATQSHTTTTTRTHTKSSEVELMAQQLVATTTRLNSIKFRRASQTSRVFRIALLCFALLDGGSSVLCVCE